MKIKQSWKSVKLSDEDVKGILHVGAEGSLTQREISIVYGVSQAYVSRILSGKASRVKVEGC